MKIKQAIDSNRLEERTNRNGRHRRAEFSRDAQAWCSATGNILQYQIPEEKKGKYTVVIEKDSQACRTQPPRATAKPRNAHHVQRRPG